MSRLTLIPLETLIKDELTTDHTDFCFVISYFCPRSLSRPWLIPALISIALSAILILTIQADNREKRLRPSNTSLAAASSCLKQGIVDSFIGVMVKNEQAAKDCLFIFES
jgi:hypothetical protein